MSGLFIGIVPILISDDLEALSNEKSLILLLM
jgi:hypothetical protein